MNQETRIIQQSVFFLRCFGAEVLATNHKSWREGCPLGTGHRESISATKRPQNCAVTAHSSRIWSMSLPDGCKKHTFLDFAYHNVLDNQLANIAVVANHMKILYFSGIRTFQMASTQKSSRSQLEASDLLSVLCTAKCRQLAPPTPAHFSPWPQHPRQTLTSATRMMCLL